jgi:MFS transporter, NNP family, nitrate/nitrite transporter
VVVTALTIAPVLFLAVTDAYPALLVGGFLLGLGGGSFAIGIPFVNAWVPPERRGLALGIYGLGNGGTAMSGFVSPSLADASGLSSPFLAVAAALALAAIGFALFGRDAPGRVPGAGSMIGRFVETLKLPVARDLALMYAVTFGGFVAFGVSLPTLLTEIYGLTIQDAALRAAGFIVLATLARPVGGLADWFGGAQVLLFALVAVGLGAILTAFEPDVAPATVGYLRIATAMGVGSGAVFALVGRRSPPSQVGSVTGLVGAAGGLGDFMPPLLMAIVLQATRSYAIGLMLLSNVAFAGAIYTAWRLRPA